ncbi:hypothetical protein C823_005453 [Eubacterium plexicaudatum ASF492]|uniref:HTH cro/C1-type domain-containing protein n=1 Tax=Eubacterium plexicaudatum ASF492 TaxID=1235802 RepID=N2BB64_9FIRM|nr:hypothetical protein C823_005453 [Eubacterium plexicaudatum ASF492]
MKEEYVLSKVTQLLEERNWTLYRLAKEADISYSTLSNTFHRNNVPSVSTLMRVCDGLGITLSEFFDEEGTAVKKLTIADQRLLADFHRLPREEKKLLTAYMQGLLKIAVSNIEETDMQMGTDISDEADSTNGSDENGDKTEEV